MWYVSLRVVINYTILKNASALTTVQFLTYFCEVSRWCREHRNMAFSTSNCKWKTLKNNCWKTKLLKNFPQLIKSNNLRRIMNDDQHSQWVMHQCGNTICFTAHFPLKISPQTGYCRFLSDGCVSHPLYPGCATCFLLLYWVSCQSTNMVQCDLWYY